VNVHLRGIARRRSPSAIRADDDPSSLPPQLPLARVLVHSKDYCNATDITSNLLDADPTFYIARRYRV
jgi:hypothetical protein